MKALILLFILAVSTAEYRNIYGQQSYDATDNTKLHDVANMLKATVPPTPETNQGLMNLLHTTLHQNMPPSYTEKGQMVNELHPPVKVVIERPTKTRSVPHRDAQPVRRVPAGSVLVALATTPDMLWIQVGKDEFLPTRDAKLDEPLNREQPKLVSLVPALDIHVKGDVVVRKIPDIGGKPVARLRKGQLLTATAVTFDYAWMMIGENQFIPTASAKIGDPTTPLMPPVTIHLKRDSVVREQPSMTSKPVTTLQKGDIMQAIGVSSDLVWLKVSHNNFVRTYDCRLGLPLPPTVSFPHPLTVVLVSDAQVIKNPHYPENILRWLQKGDELKVFGASADMKWLVVAEKRFIPMDSAKLKSQLPDPIKLNPAVPIKLSKAVEVRDAPDESLGKVLMVARRGDKYDAIAVSEDFSWLSIGRNMWIPMMAAFFSKPRPVTNALVPPMLVTMIKDTKARKTPDHFAKVVKVLAEGDSVTAFATTPDLEWLQIDDKLFVSADGVKLEDQTLTAPLFPSLRVVVTKDVVVRKQPTESALPVRRLLRGEVIDIHESTTDMKWLKMDENMFFPTEFAAHVGNTVPLTPAVKMIVAADVKVRNVPSFAGMPVRNMTKGEIVEAVEVTTNFKWVKLSKDQYLPASACVLHDSEGKDMRVVLKIRSENIVKDRAVAKKAETKPVQSLTTSQAASLFKEAFEKRTEVAQAVAAAPKPTEVPVVGLTDKLDQLVVKEDTLVYEAPDATSALVRGIPKGTIVDASGLGTNLVWLKIGVREFIKVAATEPLSATARA